MEEFSRTELLLGADAVEKLAQSRVAVFGIGGVGGFTAEALVRAGVGTIDIIDSDTVSLSNINRQLVALHSTVGRYKVDVASERFIDINPDVTVNAYKLFFSHDNADSFDFSQYDYVVDAVDTVTAKLIIIERAQESGVPVISSMGAGNKLDPTRFEVSNIYKTSVCPLARVMRYECKKRGIKPFKCVYSKEQSVAPRTDENGKVVPASVSFVPSVAGLIIAGEVIKDLIGVQNERK